MSLSYSTRNGVTTPDALTYKDASFIANVVGSGVPVLDQDVNLISMVQAENMAELVRQQVPSGWLETIGAISSTAASGVIRAAGTTANVIQLGNSAIENVIVNGYKLEMYKSFTSDSQITLNAVDSSGERTDLVFLEVWLKELKEPASSSAADRRVAGLLDDGTIPTYGNVDYYGSSLRNGGITNDLIDTNVGLETNRRIQVQYRLRVVDDIDIDTYEEGIDDTTNVKAWPSNKRTSGDGISETSYTFSGQTTDRGLYRAGNGDATSKTNIGSLDGYVYAIPICAVHRRNSTAYDVSTNPNGAGVAIGGTSDRPDGLFYDQIVVRDVIDLRHQISFTGFDYENIFEENMKLLVTGNLKTNFVAGDDIGLKNTIHGTKHMYCEQFGGADANYVNNRSTGNNPSVTSMDTNGQRFAWRDNAAELLHTGNVAQGTTSLPSNVDYGAYRSNGTGNWVLNDIITITCPSWATIDASETIIYRQDTGANVTADFNISGDSSTVTCTINANPPAWTAVSNLSVVYQVEYPAGEGLVHLPTSILSLADSGDNLIFGDGIGSNSAYQEAGLVHGTYSTSTQYGVYVTITDTSGSDNQIQVTVPTGLTATGIAAIYNNTTTSYVDGNISTWSQSGQTLTITTSSGITSGDSVEVKCYVDRAYCTFQEETKSITEYRKTKEVTITLDGSGDGTYYLDYGELGKEESDMRAGKVNIRKVSDNGVVTGAVAVSLHKVAITGCSVTSQDVKTTITVIDPPLNNDHLRIWYEYTPYSGLLPSNESLGSFSLSTINAVAWSKKAMLSSIGTGGVSTAGWYTTVKSETLPANVNSYEYDCTSEAIDSSYFGSYQPVIFTDYVTTDGTNSNYTTGSYFYEDYYFAPTTGTSIRGSINSNTSSVFRWKCPDFTSGVNCRMIIGALGLSSTMKSAYTVTPKLYVLTSSTVSTGLFSMTNVDIFNMLGRPIIK